MNKIIKELIILVGIAGLIWLGVAYFDFFPKYPKLISEEKEEELGEIYLETILKNPEFKKCENEKVTSTIDTICILLENAIEEPIYNYEYVVIENSMINAFTLPGGKIVVTTGLINYCETADEIAGVIAHEFGHAQGKHIISRLVKELGIEIITGGDTFVLGEITKAITSSSFDRKQEEMADMFACELLEKANLEPRILARLFRRLKEDTHNKAMEHFEIVASHPNFSSRIKEILAYEVEEGFKADPLTINWDEIKVATTNADKE